MGGNEWLTVRRVDSITGLCVIVALEFRDELGHIR